MTLPPPSDPIVSPFQIAAAMASAAVDDQYGEAFLFIPMMPAGNDVNAALVPDIERAAPAAPITAVWHASYERESAGGHGRMQGVRNERPGHAAIRPQVSWSNTALPYGVRHGDRLQRVSTGLTYTIAEPRRADPARTRVDVNQV